MSETLRKLFSALNLKKRFVRLPRLMLIKMISFKRFHRNISNNCRKNDQIESMTKNSSSNIFQFAQMVAFYNNKPIMSYILTNSIWNSNNASHIEVRLHKKLRRKVIP